MSGKMCYCLTSFGRETVSVCEVGVLSGCSHEEADTRMLLHAQHAATSGYSSIVIKSPDIDVAVLSCMHFLGLEVFLELE